MLWFYWNDFCLISWFSQEIKKWIQDMTWTWVKFVNLNYTVPLQHTESPLRFRTTPTIWFRVSTDTLTNPKLIFQGGKQMRECYRNQETNRGKNKQRLQQRLISRMAKHRWDSCTLFPSLLTSIPEFLCLCGTIAWIYSRKKFKDNFKFIWLHVLNKISTIRKYCR